MSTPTIAELKHAADIRDVWAALGGGKLCANRGAAFWRNGDGLNVALDADKGCWFDHRDNIGGDTLALVQIVRGCDFRDALAWLSNFTGLSLSASPRLNHGGGDNDWATDLKWATWWRLAVEALAEETLETLPSTSPRRYAPTALLRAIKLGDAALVGEYRERRKRFPHLTAAMTQAGKRHDARIQRQLMAWIVRFSNAQPEA